MGELGTFTKGAPLSKADITETGTPLILYGELYTTYGDIATTIVRKTDKDVKSECYSILGDVIIPTSGESPEEISTCTCVMQDGVILAGDLNIYRTNDVDGRFLSYEINHIRNSEIAKIAQGKSIVHIKADELEKVVIRFPSKTEQLKIIEIFSYLDKKIELQKELIKSLKLYKRGVIEAIYDQKIRFKDKNNTAYPKWSKTTIGKLFNERNERAIGEEDLLAVTINNGIQKKENIDSKDTSNEDKSNYKRVLINDIAYNTMRMWQGASGVSRYCGIVSPAYTVITPKDTLLVDSNFYAYYFKLPSMVNMFEKYSQGLTSDTWNLKYQQLSCISLFLPSLEEQKEVVSFLTNFDVCIENANDSLNQTVNTKKYLLQQMFT